VIVTLDFFSVLGSYEYLARLEGKLINGIFFCLNKSDNYSVIIDRKMQNSVFWLIFILIACFVESIEAYGFIILRGFGGI
jgi:hypothetical protein